MSQPVTGTGGEATRSPSAQPGPVTPPGLLNVANELTMLRLVLVPVFVLLLLASGPGWQIAAFVVFLGASLTDLLDGRLARQRGLITDFGKIADPIADKALTGAALITLSAQGRLPWWVTIVILVREVGVTALRFWVIRYGVIAASRGGKIKTILQVLAIELYVLPGPPGLVRAVVMGLAVVVTLVTGADYALRAVRLRRRSAGGASRRAGPAPRRAGPAPRQDRPGEGPDGPAPRQDQPGDGPDGPAPRRDGPAPRQDRPGEGQDRPGEDR